ncbi:MAG: hypothetical protein RLY71_3703 [Pseudomonadota bacterium]|jgi:GNAT superfamily N-acetyltransferase
MHITKLTVSDVPRYRELMLHAYATVPDAYTSTAEERAGEPHVWWAARIEDARGLSQAFGAEIGDDLVGTVTMEYAAKPKTRHKALLIGMFVRESARGLGVGRALVQAALADAAGRAGLRVVTLTVTDGNAAATRLYESVGFSTFGVEPMAIATPAGFLAKRHMWLELPPAQA